MVDTNVLITANGPIGGNPECAANAARYVQDITSNHVLLEDNLGETLAEYKRHLSGSGQPGVGDAFFKWYMNNRWTKERIEQVDFDLTRTLSSYVPAALQAFDNDDHKWIAIFLEGGAQEIANCSDSDWARCKDALSSAGILVNEICP